LLLLLLTQVSLDFLLFPRAALDKALLEGEECRVQIAQLTQELAEQKDALAAFEQQSAEAIAQLQGDVSTRVFRCLYDDLSTPRMLFTT
jgi:hypothetical protein